MLHTPGCSCSLLHCCCASCRLSSALTSTVPHLTHSPPTHPPTHPPSTGLYYPAGSLKAHLCVAGKHQLYAFCEQYGVPHRRLGKLLVASSPAQMDALSALAARAAANGVNDLRPLSKAEVAQLEPAVRCEAALLSPSTGIIDSHRCGMAWSGCGVGHMWLQACVD